MTSITISVPGDVDPVKKCPNGKAKKRKERREFLYELLTECLYNLKIKDDEEDPFQFVNVSDGEYSSSDSGYEDALVLFRGPTPVQKQNRESRNKTSKPYHIPSRDHDNASISSTAYGSPSSPFTSLLEVTSVQSTDELPQLSSEDLDFLEAAFPCGDQDDMFPDPLLPCGSSDGMPTPNVEMDSYPFFEGTSSWNLFGRNAQSLTDAGNSPSVTDSESFLASPALTSTSPVSVSSPTFLQTEPFSLPSPVFQKTEFDSYFPSVTSSAPNCTFHFKTPTIPATVTTSPMIVVTHNPSQTSASSMMQSASDIQNPPPPALTWTTATVYSPVLVLEPSRPSPPTPTSARPIRILPKPPPVTSASCTVGSSGYATPGDSSTDSGSSITEQDNDNLPPIPGSVSKIPVTENSTPSTGPASGSKYQPLAARLTPNGSRARDRFLLSKLDKKRNDKACLLISQKTQEQLLSCFHRNESLLVDYIQGRHLELLFCLVERFRRNLGIQQFHYILNTMNIRGESPLSAAIRLGDQDLLAYLLECGANPLTRISHDSDTALHLMAREAGNLPMIQTLLQWTPPVRIQQLMNAFNGRGLSPLHVAIESWTASNNTEKTIQLLLEKGGAVKTSNGASVFHLASQKDTSDVFRLILGIHPHAVEDLNSQDRVGNTALHAIAKNAILPDQEKVRMLVMLIGKYRGNGSIRNSQGRLCKDYLSHFAKSLFRQEAQNFSPAN